jgi:tetratricopeptide (TPR) repeat protein
MWTPVMSLRGAVLLGIVVLGLSGCGGRYDPYGAQVQRAEGLARQGEESLSQGNLSKASRDFSRSLEVSRSVDNPPGVARQINNLGAVALEEGDLKKARELFTQAWEMNQGQGQWRDASVNQANLATVAQKAEAWQDAAQHLQMAENAAQWSKSRSALGRVLIRWASFYIDQQNYASAAASLARARKLAATPTLRGALAYQKGRLALAQGNTGAALESFHQALLLDREVLDRSALAADLFAMGETYQLRGEMPQAWDHFSRAFDVYASLNKKSSLERCLVRLREVNTQGQLRQSLERYQKQTKLHPPHGK